jgi:hypothetical protein
MTALSVVPPWERAQNQRILAGDQLANSAGTAHDNHLREVFYESGAASKLVCELRWICNRAKITVKDHIALVRSILFSLRCGRTTYFAPNSSLFTTWKAAKCSCCV